MRYLIALVGWCCCIFAVASQDNEQYQITFIREIETPYEGGWLHAFYLTDLDGTYLMPLTDIQRGTDSYPNWTPDGAAIVFASTRYVFPENSGYKPDETSRNQQIYIAHLGNPSPTRLTYTQPDTSDSGTSYPVLSPDGQYITFQHQNSTFVMSADDSQFVQLLASAFRPVWSPDSCCVALNLIERISDVSERNIVKVNISTHEIVQLTDQPGLDYALDWSAATNQILFLSERSGDLALFRMRPDGTEVVQLTEGPVANGLESTWSPDGQWIAYAEFDTNDLVVITPDGELLTRIPEILTYNPQLQWLSDNTALLFYGPAYDEASDTHFKGIRYLETACLNEQPIACDETDITTIPGTESPANSDFAVSPVKLPSE